VIPAIDRKLIRDLFRIKSQAVAIALVMSCGVAAFVMGLCTLLSLLNTRDEYYDRSNFAHVFAHVKRAPRSLEDRIQAIPGVALVQTRVVVDVNLDIPGLDEPAVGHLVSIPDTREPLLNRLYLRRGRLPEYGREGEIVAGEAFMQAHGFELGHRIAAVINGRYQELTIVGEGLSPEYIYSIRPGDLLPDDLRFGVFWMGYTALAEAFDMEGAFNDVALSLLPGASEQDVIDRLDLLLDRYGSGGAYGRDDQASHRYVTDELQQLASMAILPPSIFLSVSAFLINMVLTRIIRTQREQIAALKAFGYSDRQVAVHYMKLVLILGVAGGLLGIFFGWRLGLMMTEMYTRFFRFPAFDFVVDPRVALAGIAMTVGMGALGALGAARKAAALPPAEAMRPEPPPEYRPTLVERIGLQHLFAGPSRMILRKLESHPFRAILTGVGIALGTAVLILGNFSLDAINEMMDFEFRRSQRQDMTVTLFEPTSASAAFEFQRLPGVLRSETFRAVPVRIRAGNIERRVAIQGLRAQGQLQRVLDRRSRVVTLPPEGLVLSDKLAGILNVRPGDLLTVEVLEGERPVRQLPLAATVSGFIGTAAYMNIDALNRFMQEGKTISGAFLSVDPAARAGVYSTLKEMPRVGGVTIKEAAIESFDKTVAENLLAMRGINLVFASIICFGVVYNAARITLAERSRELATMRVLGFGRGDVSYVLLGELAVLVIAAIPFGLLIGTGLAWLAVVTLETESYTVPLVILPSTYAYAAAVTLVAALVSGLVVRRNIDRLDLIAVLKNA
jgi:putative ABC transport system permease protein